MRTLRNVAMAMVVLISAIGLNTDSSDAYWGCTPSYVGHSFSWGGYSFYHVQPSSTWEQWILLGSSWEYQHDIGQC